MKTYLLPCTCSARIEIGPGQAGGTVTCAACGATLAVPRLGELARLQPAAPRQATVARAWTAAHACLLGGAAVAALAGLHFGR